MKRLTKLKLTQLSKDELENRAMNVLKGGASKCTCGCHYANYGGSSACTNDFANHSNGYTSYGGGAPSCGACNGNQCTESDFWNLREGFGADAYYG
jgi:natural product precursor